jgi:hypothetical protein
MDDVVAVAIRLSDGQERFFLTWGRIQHVVDPGPLAALILQHATNYDLGGTATKARVCWSLAEAQDALYFFEGLIHFASQYREQVPYETWRAKVADEMEEGQHLYYLGGPDRRGPLSDAGG